MHVACSRGPSPRTCRLSLLLRFRSRDCSAYSSSRVCRFRIYNKPLDVRAPIHHIEWQRSAYRTSSRLQPTLQSAHMDCTYRLPRRNRYRQDVVWRTWLQHMESGTGRTSVPAYFLPGADDLMATASCQPMGICRRNDRSHYSGDTQNGRRPLVDRFMAKRYRRN